MKRFLFDFLFGAVSAALAFGLWATLTPKAQPAPEEPETQSVSFHIDALERRVLRLEETVSAIREAQR